MCLEAEALAHHHWSLCLCPQGSLHQIGRVFILLEEAGLKPNVGSYTAALECMGRSPDCSPNIVSRCVCLHVHTHTHAHSYAHPRMQLLETKRRGRTICLNNDIKGMSNFISLHGPNGMQYKRLPAGVVLRSRF